MVPVWSCEIQKKLSIEAQCHQVLAHISPGLTVSLTAVKSYFGGCLEAGQSSPVQFSSTNNPHTTGVRSGQKKVQLDL